MRKLNKNYYGMIAALIIQSFFTILAAMGAMFFVDYAGAKFFGASRHLTAGYILGLYIPMSIALGLADTIVFIGTNSYFSLLADGITKVADGDYSVRLDERRGGSFSWVYRNFNKMAAELQNTGMLRNDFISSYSHEFKTPIVSINGFANLMLRQDVTGEERKKYLQIIADESARLADLANSTLLLSKLDTQQIITGKKNYALGEQLRQCVIMLASSWEKKNITLNGDIDEISYNGNEELMQHLWLNLLTNAVKYTNDGGEISVSLKKDRQRKDSITAVISDNGCGMSTETASHIFEKYYQGNTDQTEKGLGLGLSIVKRIVDLCGGIITVKSRENEGTAFIIELPADE